MGAHKTNMATELCAGISRLFNVATGGTSDMTFSARAGRDDLKTRIFIDWFCMQSLGEKDHCENAWAFHVEKARGALTASMTKENWQ